MRVRLVHPRQDAEGILNVYAPYILETAVTFETEVPSLADFTHRVEGIAAEFPYLVLEEEGKIIGYAYAHRQAERAAFRFNAEMSIYLDRNWTGRGLGTVLYALLEELLAMQGYINLYGVITQSNTGSIAVHERMGYKCVGLHENTGWKFGVWHGVVWLCKRLSEGAPKGEPMSIHALEQGAVDEALARTNAILIRA